MEHRLHQMANTRQAHRPTTACRSHYPNPNQQHPRRTPSQTPHQTNPRSPTHTRNRPLLQNTVRTPTSIESHFSTYKRQLNYDRLRTKDKHSLMFNWLADDLFQINTALVAHRKRTGKDVSRWYGNHFPNARAGPMEEAALTPQHCPSHQTTAAPNTQNPEPSPNLALITTHPLKTPSNHHPRNTPPPTAHPNYHKHRNHNGFAPIFAPPPPL